MELYTFKYNEELYQYHSGKGPVLLVVGEGTFSPQPIGRKEFSRTFTDDDNTITLPADLDPAPAYRYLNPTTLVEVEVKSYPDLRILFTGVVAACKFKAETITAEFKVQGKYTLNDGIIPIRTFGTSCSWALFGTNCGVDKSLFGNTMPSTQPQVSPDGYSMVDTSFATFPDGYFAGGYLETNPAVQYQYILSHTGNTIHFLVPFNLAHIGNTISVFAGCDKTAATCTERFDNFSRFSGFPYIPEKNPVTEGF